MRVSVQIVDDSGGPELFTEVARDLFNEAGEASDDIRYPEAVSQAIVIVRAAVLAAYGYDLPEVWEPIIDALP